MANEWIVWKCCYSGDMQAPAAAIWQHMCASKHMHHPLQTQHNHHTQISSLHIHLTTEQFCYDIHHYNPDVYHGAATYGMPASTQH
jgi:hypothetical protein